MMRGIQLLSAIGVALLLAGCATAPADDTAGGTNDPYEQTNRALFDFNNKLDENVFLPGAKLYVAVLPDPAREGIHNFLINLDLPVTFANDVMQGELDRGGETMMRALVNTTVGVGGLLDVATKIGIPYHTEDFGQTLAVYGVPAGPYLFLPVLGPKPPRDLAGYVADIYLDPTTYITIREHFWWSAGRFTVEALDLRSRNIDTLASIERSSVDYYASVRSLYRQNRENEIRNGKTDVQNLPNF
ncbi:MAG TPA: VacJ family lipoprotein [Rhizomicrobium sp.]|jgi:phospholipid-binding lipoprotein MlaA|nr:VacJ family lipoprotein [Rhizomicrobium sp.]